MAEGLQPEEVLELHPLDEVGSDINQILRINSEVIRTSGGITHARSIKIGDVSIFFARFQGSDRDTFTVGLDRVKDEEFIPLTDDFVWDIHNPHVAEEDIHKNVNKLGEMVHRLVEEEV